MGVADNRTYKNEYLFNERYNSVFKSPGITAEENPSMKVDPKVNSTIKENPYRSNVEIEGDEVVLQPDLSALFKAVGSKHSRGGMDVMLKPDAFVFSDYDGLTLAPKDIELFELKEGGKKVENTPANILRKNVDIKHYNRLVTVLADPFKDDLAKKSSSRMLEKYISTLGNIAFIQEEKKGFPQGVPDFAMGTAPVYNPQLKDQIMENKQYAKAGGTVDNPYLPKAQMGYINALRAGMGQPKKKVSGTVPNDRQDRYIGQRPPYPDTFTNYYDTNEKKQYTAPDWITPKDFYAVPGMVEYMSTLDKIKGVDNDLHKADDAVWGHRHDIALQHFFPNGKPVTPVAPPDSGPIPHDWPEDTPPTQQPPSLIPGDVTGGKQGMKIADWRFTPWQKKSHLYDWMNWANVNKYGATRSHYDATFINPALVNPEQAVGDARALANQQVTAANVLNPILRNAQASSAYGKFLEQVPGIRSQYDNQNTGIVNNFRQYNNQVKNNESLINIQNDKDFARDSTVASVNYDNMKQFLKNKAVSDTMTDVATNQKLAYSLLQQNNPAYGFDWDSGNLYRNPKNILDAQTGDAKSDMYTELAQTIMGKIKSGKNPTPEEVNFMKSLAVGKLNFSQGTEGFKKGGKVRNPYK